MVGPEQSGNSGGNHPNSNNRWVTDLVATYTGIKNVTLGLNVDVGGEQDEPNLAATRRDADASWWGAAAYAAYEWTEKLRTALRVEYFQDTDGIRTFASVNGAGDKVGRRQPGRLRGPAHRRRDGAHAERPGHDRDRPLLPVLLTRGQRTDRSGFGRHRLFRPPPRRCPPAAGGAIRANAGAVGLESRPAGATCSRDGRSHAPPRRVMAGSLCHLQLIFNRSSAPVGRDVDGRDCAPSGFGRR
ncbi:MAG: outer membrane beta-barrel protein [Candidatus Rokubacteria bacterium]|nr:outer membrane beta-barrel protein [Candidatus Rokubacteria bacterium]